MDTPGLADLSLRQQAAEAIDEALRSGGNFSIVFVITHEEGRIRPDDLTTMKLVFDAVNAEDEQVGVNDYAVLVNKNKTKWMRTKLDKPKWIGNLHASMTAKNIPRTDNVYFAPFKDELECEDDACVALDPDTRAFMDTLPVVPIVSERV